MNRLYRHIIANLPADITERAHLMQETLARVSLSPDERTHLRQALRDLDAHVVALRDATLELPLEPARGSARLSDKVVAKGSSRQGDKVATRGSARLSDKAMQR